MSSAASGFLAWIGWAFLPPLVSAFILTVYYRIITRAGDRIPQTGSIQYARHYRRVHMTVILLYLFYTVIEVYDSIRRSSNFYELLSVPHDIDSVALRSRFRRLTVQFHPDKVGAEGVDHFVALKTAYDVLSNPSKRFAYERFGPAMLDDRWKHCSSVYDYLLYGATQLVPVYGFTLLLLVVMTVLGRFEFGRYWRYVTFAAVFTFETAVLTRPYSLIPIIPLLSHQLVPFEQLVLARRIALSCTIAVQQLAPFLREMQTSITLDAKDLNPRLDRLMTYISHVDNETTQVLHAELLPFLYEDGIRSEIQRKMQAAIIEIAIRQDSEVRDAVGKVIYKRKKDASVGAKGKK